MRHAIHGTWQVCTVETNPISGMRQLNCHRFGFGPNQIHEIERGDKATHVYVPKFSDAIDRALEAFVEGLVHPPEGLTFGRTATASPK